MQFRLQRCLPHDLEELVQISRKTFIESFEKDNNPADFKTYIESAFASERLLSELNDVDSSYYFVFKGTELVGYFKLNENNAQTDIGSPQALELERIYVSSSFQGQHIGHWMMDEVKKIAADKQKKFLWLGVWEKNRRAIEFYSKQGFFKFGTHPYYIGKDKQTDWLMRFDIQSKQAEGDGN
ncbi:MAG: GNAT family N-acetyltransferase [Pricia sp.]|nr:GNAT family N-acetyltransferase [Pricia sp.]